MRAWLLLLTVLATFKPIVQVASTEDISSKFITAISSTRLTAAATAAAVTTTATTALTKSYQPVIKDITQSTATSASSSAAVPVAASSSLLYQNSDSDNNSNNNNSDNNLIINIKNIEEIEGAVNEEEEVKRTVNNLNIYNSDNDVQTEEELTKEMTVEAETESTYTTADSLPAKDHSSKQHDHQHKQHNHQHQHQHHHEQHHHKPVATDETNSENSSSSSSSSSSSDIDDDDDTNDDIDSEPETYSNKEIINEKLKPDPSTLVEIENSLLSLFNMKRPPKIDRSKIIIPEAMKQLYEQIMGHDIDSVNIPKPGLLTKSANTVRSFTHQDSKIDERFAHHHRFRLHFNIKSIPSEEKLKAAELQLTRDAISHVVLNTRLANRTRYSVLVYDITRVGIRGKREPNFLLLDNKTIRLNSTDTISLDVQPAVDRWLESPKQNYGLLIEVRTFRALKPAPHHHVRLRRSADEPHNDWQRKQPLLFTYTDDGRHKSRSIRDVSTRSKRAGHHRRPHRRKNNEETCRRQSLYVDFTDVGWSDWIVAPPGYDAYYCHGKCPFPLADHLNSTNHAVVQTLVNNINPGKVPKACCVPTQLTGISMLYLNDQSTVVLKNYQDMTVVGCGCR